MAGLVLQDKNIRSRKNTLPYAQPLFFIIGISGLALASISILDMR